MSGGIHILLHSLVGLLFLIPLVSIAGPVVSVDMDPFTAGVQTSAQVANGTSVTVDIVISGAEIAAPLNAFEFDLDFDDTTLDAISNNDGGFLLPTVTAVESDVTAPDTNFALATLGPVGADGSGVLASVSFDAVAVGGSALTLNGVVLSTLYGVGITPDAINSGNITVTAAGGGGSVAAPAVSVIGTLLLALLLLLFGVRRTTSARKG